MIFPYSFITLVALTVLFTTGDCEPKAHNVLGGAMFDGIDSIGTHRLSQSYLLRDLSCALIGGSDFVIDYGIVLLENICSTLRIATPNITSISDSRKGRIVPPMTYANQEMYIRYYPLDSHADLWSMFSLGGNIQAIVLDQSQPKGDFMEDLRNSLRINGLKWIILKDHLNMIDGDDTIIELGYDKYVKCEEKLSLPSVTLCTVLRQLDDEPISTMTNLRRFLLADAAREWLLFWVKSFRYYDTLLFDTSKYGIDVVSDVHGRGALEGGEEHPPSFRVRFSLGYESVKYTIRLPVNGFLLNVIESDGNEEKELVGIRRSTLKMMVQREFDI